MHTGGLCTTLIPTFFNSENVFALTDGAMNNAANVVNKVLFTIILVVLRYLWFVDNRIVLPVNTHIRVLVTAADVLHSWAVPSLGIKIDACAGRLNQTSVFILRSGVFYGQCSEICGVGHGNMPIVIEAVSLDKYIVWLSEKF